MNIIPRVLKHRASSSKGYLIGDHRELIHSVNPQRVEVIITKLAVPTTLDT